MTHAGSSVEDWETWLLGKLVKRPQGLEPGTPDWSLTPSMPALYALPEQRLYRENAGERTDFIFGLFVFNSVPLCLLWVRRWYPAAEILPRTLYCQHQAFKKSDQFKHHEAFKKGYLLGSFSGFRAFWVVFSSFSL